MVVPAPLSSIEPQPAGLLAGAWLSEKPHQGFAPSARTLHQAIAFSKPLTASGFEACGYDFGRRSRSTGKLRDNETGLDFFERRYNSSAQGRFTSPDPVTITPERLFDPQQLNQYAYVRNNPLRLIDPHGEVLQCTGDSTAQQKCVAVLQQVAGDAASHVTVDSKTGTVSFDTKGVDLSKNEGAKLINNLVSSSSNYGFTVGGTIQTAGGPMTVSYVENLPRFSDQLNGHGPSQTDLPPQGFADVVAINFDHPGVGFRSNTKKALAEPYTVGFHELAEAYAKIDGGQSASYNAGHDAACDRENILRDQRPYLKNDNPGSGGRAEDKNPDTTEFIIRK